MSKPKNQTEAIADRRQQIIDLAMAGRVDDEIAEIIGFDFDSIKKERKKIFKEEGLTLPKRARLKEQPFGITDKSHRLRWRLGSLLAELAKIYHPVEVAQITGINQKAQDAAKGGRKFNWTLAQMERVCEANGVNFKEFIRG